MKRPDSYTTPLLPGQRYHLYNRGNNRQRTFFQDRDYQSFLSKWQRFICPVAKTYAYSLLPNHFHTVIEIRERPLASEPFSPETLFVPESNQKIAALSTDLDQTPAWVTRAFTNFFISYSRTIQNRQGHHGAVFHSPFKRIVLCDDLQLDHTLGYVHYNAHKHGIFHGRLEDYGYSSYRSLLNSEPTFLERDFVLEYFGGLEKFVAYHKLMAVHFGLQDSLEG